MQTAAEIVTLKPYQKQFYLSNKRYPALIAGIGTGKTFVMLLKILKFCEDYPDSLALIVRKEFTDLKDSTMRDWLKYTGIPVPSDKDIVLPNGSTIMFRHGSEIAVLKNINLSIFGIEQAEEFESDETFTFLRDRLRRPNAPYRQGIVIGNVNGDNWIKQLWKDGKLEESELIEATTFDNEDNLVPDFIEDLKRMQRETPAHYKQYVLNDWSVTDDQFIVISPESLEALKGTNIRYGITKRVVACDPATGGDECVIYFMENWAVKEELILFEKDTMKIAGQMKILAQKWDINDYCLDSIGLGQGIGDRLREMGGEVRMINSSEKSSSDLQWYNLRAEMWWNAMQMILDKKIPYPQDPDLRKQLSSVRFKMIDSNGLVQLEPKLKTKERLGHSPDRADAFIYGLYSLRYVQPYKTKDRWADMQAEHEVVGRAVSAMAA